MPPKHAPTHDAGAIGGGLPFKGRHGKRNAILACTILVTASLVVGGLQRNSAAAVLFFCGGWLCLYLRSAWDQGARWAVASTLALALASVASFTAAQTKTGDRPAQLVSASAAGGLGQVAPELRDCLVRWFTTRKHEPGCGWGDDTTAKPKKSKLTNKPGKKPAKHPTSTTRRPR